MPRCCWAPCSASTRSALHRARRRALCPQATERGLSRADRPARQRRARRLSDRTREFWSLPLKVTPAVLVPRPETELLVEHALGAPRRRRKPRTVLDLGHRQRRHRARPRLRTPARTHRRRRHLAASALGVARDNARALGLTTRRMARGLLVRRRPERALRPDRREPALRRRRGPRARGARRGARARAGSAARPGSRRSQAIIAPRPVASARRGGWLLLEHGADQAARSRAAARAPRLRRHRCHLRRLCRPAPRDAGTATSSSNRLSLNEERS